MSWPLTWSTCPTRVIHPLHSEQCSNIINTAQDVCIVSCPIIRTNFKLHPQVQVSKTLSIILGISCSQLLQAIQCMYHYFWSSPSSSPKMVQIFSSLGAVTWAFMMSATLTPKSYSHMVYITWAGDGWWNICHMTTLNKPSLPPQVFYPNVKNHVTSNELKAWTRFLLIL